MRLVVLAVLLTACAPSSHDPSSLNQQPGKYRDYADYLIAHDSVLQADVAERNATPAQAHCVAENYGRELLQSNYDMLSDAVSGRRPATHQQVDFAMRGFRQAVSYKTRAQDVIKASWAKCMS